MGSPDPHPFPPTPLPFPLTANDVSSTNLNAMRQYPNVVRVQCDDASVFGMRVKHFDTSRLPSRIVLDPEAIVRFCTKTGDVLMSDLLYTTYNTSDYTSARGETGVYLHENINFTRNLGVKYTVQIHNNVRVTLYFMIYCLDISQCIPC